MSSTTNFEMVVETKTLIYIDVKGYPTKVWYPVSAEHQHGNCYRILDPPDDPEHEYWQFELDNVVRCELNEFHEGEQGLIAVSLCECEK